MLRTFNRNSARAAATWIAAALITVPIAASGQAQGGAPAQFITLGTMGGPVPDSSRSQPANVIIAGRDAYLVDIGDGTAGQLAKAGIALPRVRAVFISHLHFDHTGGLGALLGLRYQTNAPGKLTIYGPPGTKELVAGLAASMVPGATAGYGLPGAPYVDPANTLEVIELRGDDDLMLGRIRVRTVANTHYSFPDDSDLGRRFRSLSIRFDMPDRSILYTGDTGPSRAVESLAKGADLLVAEMIDVDRTMAKVRANTPNVSADAASGLMQHLSKHHLTPLDVGRLAAAAQVKSLVVTHLAAPGATGTDELKYLRDIAANFSGPAVIAHDLDAF
ncbi:MBL fold metallo-hydrolase [Novosphingobium mathurense]|uniref:Ribonuclease BN, tRNA processing enzyme n=1 Tax=Novosphingobium mathurense TaxID=428990 RepID=A0A1U6I7X7_9SPHN|nr:MBL fold metallo-hydrolase [Novosphingobium mathurense]SLK04125.1 Ribonuclease BN, tRNA processing enzyme [Novosphingobium mathurense]